jgi:A/G-specific adenine glycosylase
MVAEFMLQQTQVDTVVPYYRRFLERFPTLEVLAGTSQSSVLKAWEGLGYYTRARNLHRAARAIVERFDGVVPSTYADLVSLPGFGPYTTAAVLSIAFNRAHAVVDGNVIRVLCRVFGIAHDVTRSSVKKQLSDIADRLLPKTVAGDFNQAVMEMGATVCRPRSPECGSCPIGRHCEAFATDRVESLPVRSPRKARPHHTMGVAIVRLGSEVLISRRPQSGLLAGLWEFPCARVSDGESLQSCCLRAARAVAGIEAKVESRFRTVDHAYTHFSVTMHAFLCAHEKGTARSVACADARWVEPGDLSDYAFSRANRKLIEALSEESSELF